GLAPSWRRRVARRGGAGSGWPEFAGLFGRGDHGIVCDHAYLVASGPLRLVERTVCCSQEVGDLTLCEGVPGRAERGHTHRYRHSDVLSIREVARVQGRDRYVFTNPFRDAVRVQCARMREKKRELLATEAADQVIFAQVNPEGPGNCVQRP